MNGLESDTIGGFNSMVKKQKEECEKVNVTTVLFDDEMEIIHDRCSVEQVKPLTSKEYFARGCTALLDAVGSTIEKTANKQRELRDEKADKVVFVIITDGMENSSSEYTYHHIRSLIETRKEMGWEFLFLGANIDAGKEAEKIGIARNRSVTYENDKKGVALNFETVGRAIRSAVSSMPDEVMFEDDWAEDIREYKSQRKN